MTCNSRHFSWLTKSCFPDPNLHHHHHHHQNPHLRLITTTTTTTTTISSLPDDLLLEILSRISSSSLPSLYTVCRRWSYLLDSPAYLHLRRVHGTLHLSLFIFSFSNSSSSSFFASLKLGHDTSWKISNLFSGNDDVFEGSASSFLSQSRLVNIGRIVYVISKSTVLKFDTWTNAVGFVHETLLPRKKFAAAVVNGKIYVTGGSSRSYAVEEYDPDLNEWRVVSHAPRMRYGCIGAALDGVFYVIGGLQIQNSNVPLSSTSHVVPRAATQIYASSMDLYDVAARTWLRSRVIPGGGCVVAACTVGRYLYVLNSHAVELSFWRYSSTSSRRHHYSLGGGVVSGGEWCRMKSPPMPTQVRLNGRVRFNCVGVGDDKVVLIQVVGCIDELLRRGRNSSNRGLKDGLVLVYDCLTEEWSRGPDLPEFVKRAAGVCVEC